MENKFNKKMEDIFDIEPIEVLEKPPPPVPVVIEEAKPVNMENDLETDYTAARDNFAIILDRGKKAIDDMLYIAGEQQTPRAYEVAAMLIRNVAEANERLLGLHRMMKEIKGSQQQVGTNINNAIFVGSTSELSKLMKEKKKQEIIAEIK